MTDGTPQLHSFFSASASSTWINCPGALRQARGMPNLPNVYSASGTVTHSLLSGYLDTPRVLPESREGEVVMQDGFAIEVTDDAILRVRVAIDYIEGLRPHADFVLHEAQVNYAAALGVPEETAFGHLDACIGMGSELIVVDYKDGVGYVSPETPQLKLYAIGALAALQGVLGQFDTVRLVIIQPKLSHAPREHLMSVAELMAWAAVPRESARLAVMLESRADGVPLKDYLRPGEPQCTWCRAKATCPALSGWVQGTTAAPIASTDTASLAQHMKSVDLIEDWCSAVRAETERRLLDGASVPGYKLVQGKKGARAWKDEDAVLARIRTLRLSKFLIAPEKPVSPITAEKLDKKGELRRGVWALLQTDITQSPGKPSVAPESDPRPALSSVTNGDEFPFLTAADGLT